MGKRKEGFTDRHEAGPNCPGEEPGHRAKWQEMVRKGPAKGISDRPTKESFPETEGGSRL